MDQFLYYSGFVVWSLVLLAILLRIIFGKSWLLKSGLTLFIGPRLLSASKKLADELPDKVKRETLAEVGTYAFLRLVNIGIITLLLAIIPIWLLFNQNTLLSRQNEKMDVQNERLNLQNNLLEADRRGSLIILMSNVLDQMNNEIETLRDSNRVHYDTVGYPLTDPLIGQIAALSQGFRPYHFLEGDNLTDEATSPERGQLLLALVKSNLDSVTYSKIYSASNFSFAGLSGASLSGADLSGASLSGADLSGASLSGADLSGADLSGADLSGADLSGAGLSGAGLSGASLSGTDLSGADLDGVDLRNADLRNALLIYADLISANLREANLRYTNLRYANFSGADLRNADLRNADLSNADLEKVKNLTANQCKQAWRLWESKNLDITLYKQLETEKLCLLKEKGCEENKPGWMK